ncbi:MAG: GNAT family N-acetyltransferase [Anaerolineae bacterium]
MPSDDVTLGPAYRIRTSRLVVRCWEPCDAPRLNAALRASWEHLRPWMPWAQGDVPPLEDTVALLRIWRAKFDLSEDFTYAVFNADESLVLGSSGLHVRQARRAQDVREIGYWIHADHINQGYATEVAAALTKVAFEIDDVRRVEIHCVISNARSAAVPRKLGFAHEADLRQRVPAEDGTYQDEMIWTLLANEYPASPASEAEITAYDALDRRIL